jgi:hypothetical protein
MGGAYQALEAYLKRPFLCLIIGGVIAFLRPSDIDNMSAKAVTPKSNTLTMTCQTQENEQEPRSAVPQISML